MNGLHAKVCFGKNIQFPNKIMAKIMEIRVYKLYESTNINLRQQFHCKTTFQIHAFFLQKTQRIVFFEEFVFVKVLIELQMRHVTRNKRIS